MPPIADYWNHNVHYQRVILNAVPPGCGAAIEVGCGDGMFACMLAARCAAVTGIDKDAPMIALARDRGHEIGNATFVEGDFLLHPFEDASFDFACANTALHHMDFPAALARMARILRPGGRLAVVGLADDGSPADWIVGAAGIPADLYYKRTRGEGGSAQRLEHAFEPGKVNRDADHATDAARQLVTTSAGLLRWQATPAPGGAAALHRGTLKLIA